MTDGIPPMQPLAPIVDRLRTIAEEVLPEPQTCRIRLYDDGTFEAYVFHSMGKDERQIVRYERTTSEITWEWYKGSHWKKTALSGGETLIESEIDDCRICSLTTVEPPFNESRGT